MYMNHFTLVTKLFVCLLVSIVLSSCGFHLRGAYQLPSAMSVTFIDAAQKNSELTRALKRRLKASDITLLDEARSDVAVLKIGQEKKSRRIVSVDSRGKAREYTLIYAISFSVKAPVSDFEIEEQTVSIDRDFLFDTEDVLGNSREESQLYDEMRQDVVRLILLRLQSRAEK